MQIIRRLSLFIPIEEWKINGSTRNEGKITKVRPPYTTHAIIVVTLLNTKQADPARQESQMDLKK